MTPKHRAMLLELYQDGVFAEIETKVKIDLIEDMLATAPNEMGKREACFTQVLSLDKIMAHVATLCAHADVEDVA